METWLALLTSISLSAAVAAITVRGFPYVEPTRVVTVRHMPSWLKTDKVQDRLPISLTAEAGLPWSCEAIRNAVANLTPEQISKLVRIYRLTDRQRSDARKCLKEKRT